MNVSINKQARLSQHFTLGELCKTSYHTLDGNIPSHVAIENLRNICENWLEDLRFSYNELYGDRREGVRRQESGDRSRETVEMMERFRSLYPLDIGVRR